jgi:hypothetical protein
LERFSQESFLSFFSDAIGRRKNTSTDH